MQTPYPSLSSAQVEIARALVACPQWRWGSGTTALRADGALVEIMPGRAMGMERTAMAGMLPLLTDAAVVGHLSAALDAACGPRVTWSCGRQGEASYEAHLEAGPHKRTWTGTCLGEAVAGALVARWQAIARRPPPGRTVAVPVRSAAARV